MKTDRCYIVCGATWPYVASCWKLKADAEIAANEIRRKLIKAYPRVFRSPRDRCGVTVEPRNARDMIHFTIQRRTDARTEPVCERDVGTEPRTLGS